MNEDWRLERCKVSFLEAFTKVEAPVEGKKYPRHRRPKKGGNVRLFV